MRVGSGHFFDSHCIYIQRNINILNRFTQEINNNERLETNITISSSWIGGRLAVIRAVDGCRWTAGAGHRGRSPVRHWSGLWSTSAFTCATRSSKSCVPSSTAATTDRSSSATCSTSSDRSCHGLAANSSKPSTAALIRTLTAASRSPTSWSGIYTSLKFSCVGDGGSGGNSGENIFRSIIM